MPDHNIEKLNAGEKAIEYIRDGMLLGLGTGSTVYYTIRKIAELVKEGMKLTAVSTSSATSQLSASLGIQIFPFEAVNKIDLTIDGADEFDPALNGIKGGGGALLFEKMVAEASDKVIWVVDSGKRVTKLGKFPLPVEVVRFGSYHLLKTFSEKGFQPVLRSRDGNPYLTDSGNYIVDLHLGEIADPATLNKELKLLTGVVETGLFINIADIIIVGTQNSTEIIVKDSS